MEPQGEPSIAVHIRGGSSNPVQHVPHQQQSQGVLRRTATPFEVIDR